MKKYINIPNGLQNWMLILLTGGAVLLWSVLMTLHHPTAAGIGKIGLLKAGLLTLLISTVYTLEKGFVCSWVKCHYGRIVKFRLGVYGVMVLLFSYLFLREIGDFSTNRGFPVQWYVEEVLFQSLVIGVTVLWWEASRLVGARPVEKLIWGKYHHPTEEGRIFLFIDLADSTRISQQLGNKGFSYFIKQFFLDIDEVVRKWQGEVYQYAGDQVIISWPAENSQNYHRAIQAFMDFYQSQELKQDEYRERWGIVPRYRAALHEGKVVVSWIGTSKREILYQGEVLNISARIMELAKHLAQPVLISQAMAEKIPSGYAEALSYQGNYPVKGVEQPVEVYAVALPAVELPRAIPSLRVAEEKPKVRVAI